MRHVATLGDLGSTLRAIVDVFSKGEDVRIDDPPIDTRTEAGKAVVAALQRVVAVETVALSAKRKATRRLLNVEQQFGGGTVPYGVQLDGDRLRQDEHEQEGIRLAVELRTAGLSLRAIGSMLAAAGHHPKRGGSWHAKTVRDQLQRGALVRVREGDR